MFSIGMIREKEKMLKMADSMFIATEPQRYFP